MTSRVRLAALALAIGTTTPLSAENRLVEGGACENETALMMITYHQSLQTPRIITNMCLNRASGRFIGAESFEGLELVRRQAMSERYEALGESNDADSRSSLEIAPSITTWSFYDQAAPEALEVNAIAHFQNGPASKVVPSSFFSMRGYLSDGAKQVTGNTAEIPVYVWANVYKGSDDDIDALAAKIPPLAFTGTMAFRDGVAEFTAQGDATYATEMGEGTASATFSNAADGSVDGSIQLKAMNSRLAGFSDGEWRSLECNVEELAGHVLGTNSTLLRAMALGTCAVDGADATLGSISIEVIVEAWDAQDS